MHRKIGLLVVAAVLGTSITAAFASTGSATGATGRQAVAATAQVLAAAAKVDAGVVLQRIASAARVESSAANGSSAAAIATDTRGVRFAVVSVTGLSRAARRTAARWNALISSGAVATAQRQVVLDAPSVARAARSANPSTALAAGIVPCTLQTADTVLLVAFFLEVDAVFIPQDCGANVSCLESNEVATVEAQEFITVILLESDINCFLFG